MSCEKTTDHATVMKGNTDKAEIVQLYQDTSDELRRLLARKLGNQQEAEEIAHDAYLKLCRIELKDEIQDLRKYLFTMSVRLALNVLRRRKTEKGYEAACEAVEPAVDHLTAYRIILGELKLEAVKEALAELPEKTRYIFLLHRFQNLTYSEIADKLALSSKSVEYHMGRALEKVMTAVEHFNVQEG